MTRKGHLRRNPIPPRDEMFLLDPYPWVRFSMLGDYCPEDDAGFFHVTTNRDRVFEQGLRARVETGVVGLGGGHSDPTGKWVSFVISRGRALWLFAAMRGLLIEAKDGSAASVLSLVLEWSGFPGDEWGLIWEDEDDDRLQMQEEDLSSFCEDLGLEPPSDILSLTSAGSWRKMVKQQGDALEKRWPTPEQRYKLAQFFEHRLRTTFSTDELWDVGICVPLVGFAASAKEYLKLSPDQFSIVQAAVREGAPYEDIPQECEMRFVSRDIQVVALDCQIEGNAIPVPPRSKG